MNQLHNANHETERLAFTQAEVCRAGNFKETTCWRLEKKGLIRRVPHLARVLYTKASVCAFFAGEVVVQKAFDREVDE